MNFSGTNWGHAPAKSFHTAGKLLRYEMQLKCDPHLSCRTVTGECVCVCVCVRAVCWMLEMWLYAL